MATNYVQEGKSMYLATVTGAKSGEPFVVGDYLPCVLLTDAGADPYMATVATVGVFKLAAKGDVSAISAGDMLYWADKDTPLDKTAAGKKPFGVALEDSTHASNSILVMLTPKATIPDSVEEGDIDNGAVTEDKIGAGAVTEAKIGTGAVTEAKLGAKAVTSDKIADDVIKVAQVTVSTAELQALVASPKTLVAAPGENKLLEFVSAVYHYDYDTTAFTVGNAENLQVKYEDESGTGVSAVRAVTGFLDQTADKAYQIPPVGVAALEIGAGINEPLVLSLSSSNGEMTEGGSSELHVKIAYRVHDLA